MAHDEGHQDVMQRPAHTQHQREGHCSGIHDGHRCTREDRAATARQCGRCGDIGEHQQPPGTHPGQAGADQRGQKHRGDQLHDRDEASRRGASAQVGIDDQREPLAELGNDHCRVGEHQPRERAVARNHPDHASESVSRARHRSGRHAMDCRDRRRRALCRARPRRARVQARRRTDPLLRPRTPSDHVSARPPRTAGWLPGSPSLRSSVSAGDSGVGGHGLGLQLGGRCSCRSFKPWFRADPFEDGSSLGEQRFGILAPILCQ
jgi:hypothetical protein